MNKKLPILAIIGLCNYSGGNKDQQDLINLLEKYKTGYKIYIFSRPGNYLTRYRKYNNVTVYSGISSEQMIKLLSGCKYILPLPNKNSWYYKDRLSGAIPLSLNNNIPMILPERLRRIYNIDSDCCIVYYETIMEIINKIIINDQSYYSDLITNIGKYKNKTIKNNKIVFKNIVDSIMDSIVDHPTSNNNIKKSLAKFPNTKSGNLDKIKNIKNTYEGKTAYVITCGPSFKYCVDYLDKIFNDPNGIVLCVKQAYNYVKEKGYTCDFHAVNFCNEIKYSYDNNKDNNKRTISIYTQKRQIPIGSQTLNNYDIIVSHRDNDSVTNIHTGIINNIDRMSFDKVMTEENNQHYWGDIMHELVLPLLVHIGCKNIYTIGWDCGNLTKYFDKRDHTQLHNRPKIREILDKQLIESSKHLYDFMKEKFGVNIYMVGNYSALKIPTISYEKLFHQQTL